MHGKRSSITKQDLLDFALDNGIPNAEAIINEVANALSQFDQYAHINPIPQPWAGIIQKTINDNLKAFGYHFDFDNSSPIVHSEVDSFTDSFGRNIANASITVNSKGHFELSALIDGHRKRRFIRPNMPQYNLLKYKDIYNLPPELLRQLIETLLPPEQ